MIELKYFDSHCHPQYSAFDADREAVLARMQEYGVGGLVVGTDLEESRKAVALANQNNFLWATVGLHPNDPSTSSGFEMFAKLAQETKVVAIGECGLDFYRNEPTKEEQRRQIERFEKHVALALETEKPLMIHCRPTRNSMNAHRGMLNILAKYPAAKAVMHFFTGNVEIAQKYLERGCYLSFPGVITFTNEYDDVVRMTPMDRILSETDSPFAAPAPHRGKRNEPSFVIETVKKIAELKEISIEELNKQIIQNTVNVFELAL